MIGMAKRKLYAIQKTIGSAIKPPAIPLMMIQSWFLEGMNAISGIRHTKIAAVIMSCTSSVIPNPRK